MVKEILLESLLQNRITCSFAFDAVSEKNIGFKLNDQTGSIGFIFRHVGEMMNMFTLFFGMQVDVQNSTMGLTDNGQGKDVEKSRKLIENGYTLFEEYIRNTDELTWVDPIETPFFGTVSKARLFSHVLFHNAHHAGQIAMTLKRGH